MMDAHMEREYCCNCGVEFHIPKTLYRALKSDSNKWFYCPNGHRQHYTESEADRLRRELERFKQNTAYLDDRIRDERNLREAAERSASARKGVITRMKRRAAAGVCPCCNRTFQNLKQHMDNQHPKFVAEEVA